MKLRKLILSGFKSFADKTEFEFDDGISCIVGPNGCGKSNVVDAVKWVLGEQSAKSLRGSEMADVIFNGSSSRRPAGGAAVSLVFENPEGLLQTQIGADKVPSGTVSVTRRLFRNGQSEYLINKTPCRLRDIREMFLDTGNAYSVVEQGRVESFLQATRDQRREIFDEAAGINKYKARKREALQKLDRVEQNLLRISDVLAEVEKRLRSIKYQAGKARSFKAHNERLNELRSLYFLSQYHTRWSQRAGLQARLDAGNDRLAKISAEIDRLEADQSGAEIEAVELERSVRDVQGRAAAVGGRITACQERAEMLTKRAGELGEQVVQATARCEQLEAKIEDSRRHFQARAEALRRVEADTTSLAEEHQSLKNAHHEAQMRLAQLRGHLEDAKSGTIDLLRRTAQLHNEVRSLSVRRENLSGQRDRLDKRSEEISHSLADLLARRKMAEARLREADNVLADANDRLASDRQEVQEVRRNEQSLQQELARARELRSATAGRIAVLREMQAKHEGLSAGARRVLEANEQGGRLPIRGVLGDFLRSDLEHAHLVEAALAGADQQLLADRLAEVQAARADITQALGEGGTVEVLCLDSIPRQAEAPAAGEVPQVIARVIDWVRFDSWLAPAIEHVLGGTLVVRTLTDAAEAAKRAPGCRFVTLDGDVLEADGRVRIGSANRGGGMIARRSELVELRAKHQRLDGRIDRLQQQCAELAGRLERLEQAQQKLRTVIYEATTERVEYQTRIAQLGEQISKLEQEAPVVAADLEAMAAEIDQAVRAEQKARQDAVELERSGAERQKEVEAATRQIAALERRRDELAGQVTEVKVALGRAEEKKRSLAEGLDAMAGQCEQMTRDLQAAKGQIELCRSRRTEAEGGIKAANDEVDRLYAQQAQLDAEAERLELTRAELTGRLEEIRTRLAEQRKAGERAGDEVNAIRVELGEADVRIENLITRAADEMDMDLLARYREYRHDEGRDWDAVAAEIAELRGKIERLGNINLDAIAEQEELEKRREFLSAQIDDIRSSQNQLNELIRRINRQSRKMFIETFQAVRTNFQQLFRKLFGGGRADIYLTDPEDVLESGIEIVARPPGKELRTLSLLSGGEKTMTALALQFSIFQTRPSPFCLLDEVDAALDEANTERFARLLQEFNEHSQFVIISHAKRTMSMAGVLYGVTMQEPGVSRRISVRFDQVDHAMEDKLEPVQA